MLTGLWSAAAALAFACNLSAAQAGTLIPVAPVPGSTTTYVSAINNELVITGHESDQSGTHGFAGPIAGSSYEVFDVGQSTNGLGINDGGFITGTTLVKGTQVPFVRTAHGVSKLVKDANGMRFGGAAIGVLNDGQFVGYALTGPEASQGFYGDKSHYEAAIELPFQSCCVEAIGYDSQGSVVGSYFDEQTKHIRGFLLNNGTATSIDYPAKDAVETSLSGVNTGGLIAGTWNNSRGNPHAFVFDTNTNNFKPIDAKAYAYAGNINEQGFVPIDVMTGSSVTPFIYCSRRQNNCPAGSGASIELPDHGIPARPGDIRSVLCKHRCLWSPKS